MIMKLFIDPIAKDSPREKDTNGGKPRGRDEDSNDN